MNQLTHWLLKDDTIRTSIDRATHTYVIGQPGTGKSRALESWIMQDIEAGHGVGVIDPHGDLFHNLLTRLSFKPQVWGRIVIIDPCSPDWVTTFNPLEAVTDYSQERLSLFLTDIIGKIWKLDLASAPRTMWLISNTFLALSSLNLTLLHLPKFLLDREYRESLLPRLTNPSALSFFRYEYPKSSSAAHQWASPVLNKIGNLIFDPDLSLMLAGKPRISFREILDRQLILLVNLPKGIIGEGVSALMGAFIVAHIQKAALTRANSNYRKPFYFYLDEFQNYTTDNIKDILSESRKYSLSMTLVHQYLEQLTPDIRNALLNTAGAIACFRVGYQDGYQLAKEIFPRQDFLESGHRGETFLPHPMLARVLMGQKDPSGWEGLAESLSGLRFREFWHKQRGAHRPLKQRTFDMPLPVITNDGRSKIRSMIATSGKLYSRSRSVVQKEIAFYNLDAFGQSNANSQAQHVKVDDGVPFWGV
jgi:hypothetical protein